jgi:hypothetical protein
MPGILEGGNLRFGGLTARLFEKHIIGGVAVEWRIEINKVYRTIRYMVAQDIQVIAVIKFVSVHLNRILTLIIAISQ